MKNNSLELRNLCIARDGIMLIEQFSYSIQAGEMLVIRGNNGSGKTTLLKTIAGLLQPMGGEILLNQHAMEAVTGKPLYIGHKRGLYASLSVSDNVRVWAEAFGTPELYEAAIHYFDLDDLGDITLSNLSAGWQQRVALTRLITMPAHVWLLDEPAANLDGEGAALLQSLIQTRMEQNGIILVASHHDWHGKNIKIININELNNISKVLH